MTKNNSFRITNKLPLWLAIPAVLIVAGLVLFFVLGFQPSATIADSKSLVITHDSYVNISEDLQDRFLDVCRGEIDEAGLQFIDVDVAETETGGQAEFRFSPETENGTLETLKTNILAALAADEELQRGLYDGTLHDNVSQYANDYIWRAAISGAVALVIAFVYVAVRYRFSMGLSALIGGIADVALMLALVLILRIPVTTTLAAAAILAVLYSVLVSCVTFGKMRSLLKSEEYASMPSADAMESAAHAAVRPVLVIGIAAAVIFALLSAFCGAAVRAFTLPVVCAVAASTFSGTLLTPSLAAAFRTCGDKMRAKREEKAKLLRQQEEAARAQKRSAAAKKD